MNGFTKKLNLIYSQLFHHDIDKFTEALIDHGKFRKDKFNGVSDKEKIKQFIFNRKTVLRRWITKGTTCTPDFQKSFDNYQLAHYEIQGEPLFTIEDFKDEENLENFTKRVDLFLKHKNRVEITTDYQYLYCFSEQEIEYFKIVEWSKGSRGETVITVEKDERRYKGVFTLSEENNIFITLRVEKITLYFLFHENNDSSCPYIVGTSMGYLPQDNKVPRAQKVIFSKEKFDNNKEDLQFILNETEVISAIENRLNLNSDEVKVTHFVKYANRLKNYFQFFKRLGQNQYQERFYYRLAFKEFDSMQKLFQKVAKKETYFIYDYQRALLELIETVQHIQNIPLQMVMQLDERSIFLQLSHKNMEIKEKFLNLHSEANIRTTIIFVVESSESIPKNSQKVLEEISNYDIDIYLVNRDEIINEVNSLDFIFIDLNDKRDFVLADPIRDSKDVYKLFTNETTMEEYKIDYQRFLEKGRKFPLQEREGSKEK